MSGHKIGFFKFFPIFHENVRDEKDVNLYFNIVDTNTDENIYENSLIIKYYKDNHMKMLFNPIISILSGDSETDHLNSNEKVKLIYDIDYLLIFDGLLDHNNKPYLLNKIQSKISCKVAGLCKSVLKHKETYESDMTFKDKKNHNIFINKKSIKLKLSLLEIASIKDSNDLEYMRVLNINSIKNPDYRFIIPSFETNINVVTDIIKNNIVYGGTVFEKYANSFMKEKIKNDSIMQI